MGLIAILSIRRPPILIGVAVCLFSFEQWTQVKSTYFVQHATLINYFFGVLTLVVIASVAIRGQNPFDPFPNGQRLMWLLFLFLAASVIWSVNVMQSFTIVKQFMPYVATIIVLTPMVLRTEKDFETALMSILYIGSVIAVLLIIGTQVHEWGRTIQSVGQVVDRRGEASDRLSPLAIAEMAGGVAIVALMLNFTGINRIWSTLRWFVVIMSVFLIVRSESRGQLFAVVAAIAIFYGASRTKSKGIQIVYGSLILGTLAIMAFFLFAQLGTDHGKRWDVDYMKEDFASTRIAMSVKLLEFWLSSTPFQWFFGLGTAASFDSEVVGYYCHIIPVEVLCELGFIGFSIYGAIMYFTARAFLRLLDYYESDRVRRGQVAAMGALFFFSFLLTLKQGTLIGSVYFGLFSVVLCRFEAVGAKSKRIEKTKKAFWLWQHMLQTNAASLPGSPTHSS